MASLTIRRLDEKLKRRLRVRAARHGRSMEEEARQILSRDLQSDKAPPQNLADAIAALVDPVGGIDLDLPMRFTSREPPRFED
jgi:plasmid stability protein